MQMKRYLIHLCMFLCGLGLIAMSGFIGRQAGVIPASISTFLMVFGTASSAIVLVLHVFDLGGPRT